MSGIFLVVIMVLIYIAPLFVARVREHRNYGSIVALNLLLGWTFVGWVAALVWALTNQKPDRVV
jgi:hypothetical protein